MTERRTWVADPTVPWNILLTATLQDVPDRAAVQARTARLAEGVGWDGPLAVVQASDEAELLRQLAASPEGDAPVGTGLSGRELVVSAHHSAVDGLGLLAALGLLLDEHVTSSARGLPDGPTTGMVRSVLARVAEAVLSPPAVVTSTTQQPRPGDVFASRTVAGTPGTAEVVAAAADVLSSRVGKGDLVVAVGLSRSGGAEPRLGDDSAFVRLRNVRGRTPADVRALLRTTPAQGSPSSGGAPGGVAGAMRLGMRLLARRLGSTVLVSHLGRVDAPGVDRLAFYPVTGGGSGLSLGAVGHGGRTTLTLRARAHQHDAKGLQEILEALCARLVG